MARIRDIVNAKESGEFHYAPKGGRTEYAKKHPKEYNRLVRNIDKTLTKDKLKHMARKSHKAKEGKKEKKTKHWTQDAHTAEHLLFETDTPTYKKMYGGGK